MATQPLSNVIDPPPRLTGDAGQDTVAVIQWLNAFYVKGILSGGLLQPQNMDQSLISLGALGGATDMLAYYTAEDVFDLTGFTAFARTLMDDIDADSARATLGAGDVDGPGSSTNNHVAVFDGTTGKLLKDGGAPAGDVVGPAGATNGNVALFDTATGKLIKDGGTLGTAAYQSVGAFDPAGAAAAITPTTLGLVIGTNVQAYDADLTTWAGVTPGANVDTALAVAVGADGAFVVQGGALGSPSSAGTIPAFTLGGTVAGGGNQINNIIIGAVTPLAGSFTSMNGGLVKRSIAYTPGATTPSVLNASFMQITNAGATSITNFTNGVAGQEITLLFTDANTTITRANCFLSGGANFVSNADDTLTLISGGTFWYETGRSINA